MDDRLIEVLKYFELHTRVFQAGPLCRSAQYDAAGGLGYIHVLQQGTLDVLSTSHAPLHITEPSLFLYMNPTDHQLIPKDKHTRMVCASFEFGAGLDNPLLRALPEVICIRLANMPNLATTLAVMFDEATQNHCLTIACG